MTDTPSIALAWDRCKDEFGDTKSLEFMIAWTAHNARVSYEEVVDWLEEELAAS